MGQVEEGWGRYHTEQVGHTQGGFRGSAHCPLLSVILPQPSQLAGWAEGLVVPAGCSLPLSPLWLHSAYSLSGRSTFLGLPVTVRKSKPRETRRCLFPRASHGALLSTLHKSGSKQGTPYLGAEPAGPAVRTGSAFWGVYFQELLPRLRNSLYSTVWPARGRGCCSQRL